MPITETPTTKNEPNEPSGTGPQEAGAGQDIPPQERHVVSTSRWIDYDTHELLEMISDLEDERRWARLREGIWLAILIHMLLLSAITWIPKYVLRVPAVIDPFDAIKQRKDLSYLDLPPDALRELQPKVKIKPLPEKQKQIDKQTLEAMNKPAPAPAPEKQPEVQNPVQPQPATPTPPTQSLSEAPRPAAVPARPNFAMGSANPADQLRDAMRGASRNQGSGGGGVPSGGGSGLPMHPGAGGGVQVLSDTQGVDFNSWLARWHRETERTWDPLIPDEVNPPILKKGVVVIRFKVLPNGLIMDPIGMFLEGSSFDTALDRAAWGAITGSNYPPLPREFHGPFLELRAIFFYNVEPSQ